MFNKIIDETNRNKKKDNYNPTVNNIMKGVICILKCLLEAILITIWVMFFNYITSYIERAQLKNKKMPKTFITRKYSTYFMVASFSYEYMLWSKKKKKKFNSTRV